MQFNDPDRRAPGARSLRIAARALRAAGLTLTLILGLTAPALAGAPQRAELPPPRPGASAGVAMAVATGASAAALEARGTAAAPAPKRDFGTAIAEAIRLSGDFGYALMDISTGEIVESREAEHAFPPASVTKAFTTVYALETLGAEHRFETRLVASAAPQSGVVRGDLALVGGGDPEFDTDALDELAAQAAGRGARQVTGALLYDVSLLPETPRIEPEQPEDVSYNAAVSALNLDFNRVLFKWDRGEPELGLQMEAHGINARATPANVRIGLGESQSDIFLRRDMQGVEVWSVVERALDRKGQRWLPVRHPGAYAGDVLRSLAKRHDLSLPAAEPGPAPSPGVTLAIRRSRPLEDILHDMMKYSTNLTAESVGLAASARQGETPQDLADSGARMSAWANLRARQGAGLSAPPPASPASPTLVASAGSVGSVANPTARGRDGDGWGQGGAARPALSAGIAATMLAGSEGNAQAASALNVSGRPQAGGERPRSQGGIDGPIDLKNHSGLSSESRVTPAAMVAFLREADLSAHGRARPGELATLMKPYPLNPARGERRLPDRVSAHAKTGTMYFVRGLAGYLQTASGRRLAFAIFSEDLERRATLADTGHAGPSRGWLGRARERERRLLRAWAAGW